MHFIIWLLGTILGTTWRINVRDPYNLMPFNDRGCKRIYCFWHSYLLALSYIFRFTGKTAIVSQSKDGRLAAAVAARWGHSIVFGSSTRGGSAALRESVRILKEGNPIAITPDGPTGPAEIVKAGVAQMAILAEAPVVAVGLHLDRKWRLRSWDRFLIPKPFAEITVSLEEPIIPKEWKLTEESIESLRSAIEEKMRKNVVLAY